MMYVVVNKLPKDCICVLDYIYPFKFSGHRLYVYEPGVNPFGQAVWYRRSHGITSPLAVHLSKLL